MAKSTRRAGRPTTAERSRSQTRKAGVLKSRASGLRRSKLPKAAPSKRKPSHQAEITRLKRQLKAARLQREASAEILRTVANASGDAAGPLRLIAETTAGLFKASSVSIQLAEGSEFTQEYRVGAIAKRIGSAYPRSNIKVGGRNLPGTVVAECRQIHIPDLDQLDPSMSDFPGLPHARAGGARTVCGTPLRRDGKAIGALIVFRDRLSPFTGDELALLQSFADQAVIAIENARLFNETQEALGRQTATADILKVIARSPSDVQPVFDAIAARSKRLVDALSTTVFRLEDGIMHLKAFTPTSPEADATLKAMFPTPLSGFSWSGAIADGEIFRVNDTEREIESLRSLARQRGFRSMLFVPLLSDNKPIGIIAVTREEPGPFVEHHVQLMQTFADQAVIAIENTRLFNETREALAYQTGSSNVLRVIASSPTDVEPVLKEIVESARELCEASDAVVLLKDAEHLRFSAHSGPIPVNLDKWPISRDWTAGRAFVDQKPVHVHDMLSGEGAEFPDARAMGQSTGSTIHTVLSVPLLRGRESVGAILLRRTEVRPFNDKQVNLLSTFADQAVIAIENTRLFNETQEALGRQTATADILKIISRSVSHAAPVFDAILQSCQRLFNPHDAAVYLIEGDKVRGVARRGAGAGDWGADAMPLEGSSTGAAIAKRQPIHFADLADKEDLPEDKKAVLRATGGLTVLYAPIISESRGVGSLVLTRKPKKPFTETEIEFIQGFADQAAIAIENARLFNEIQAKTRDLTEALTYQTGSANILNVIAASPTDVAPVLKAIVESACEVCEAYDAAVLLRDGDDLRFSAHHGPIPIGLEKWPINRRWTAGRAFIDQQPVHIEDLREEKHADFSDGRDLSVRMGHRTIVSVPLLRDKESIGAIVLRRVEVHPFSDKQIALLQTFGDQAVIALGNVRLFEEVQAKTRELEKSLEDLRTAQDRLVQTEKLASLGQLTAGIAHEIKNPLNFVNNFAALSAELIDELSDVFENPALDEAGRRKELDEIRQLLKSNLEKVVQHGKRADSIVKNMLLHSREGSGEQRVVDINALLDESLNLAYHGARAEKPGFNITLQRDLDPDAGLIELFPQEITRALLNLISNGFYAASKREAGSGEAAFEPVLSAATKSLGNHVEIRIRDNGAGIPPDVKEKIFNPFFTTKPAGEGTGLGLSMTHDIIVKQHGGRIELETQPGQFTEFKIVLPRAANVATDRKN